MGAVIGVRIIPGTTALTRTPSGPSSNAIVWVIPTIPYLEAEYGRRLGTPLIPAAELRLTMAAWRGGRGARSTAWRIVLRPAGDLPRGKRNVEIVTEVALERRHPSEPPAHKPPCHLRPPP